MRFSVILAASIWCLVSNAIPAPVTPAVTVYMPEEDSRSVLVPRDGISVTCEVASQMPPSSSAYAIADYLTNLGDQNCTMNRPQFSTDPSYTTLAVTADTEVNMYFTDKAGTAYMAQFACGSLGDMLRAMIDSCKTSDQKVRGFLSIPNCPNKGIAYLNALPADNADGAALEVQPRCTRTTC